MARNGRCTLFRGRPSPGYAPRRTARAPPDRHIRRKCCAFTRRHSHRGTGSGSRGSRARAAHIRFDLGQSSVHHRNMMIDSFRGIQQSCASSLLYCRRRRYACRPLPAPKADTAGQLVPATPMSLIAGRPRLFRGPPMVGSSAGLDGARSGIVRKVQFMRIHYHDCLCRGSDAWIVLTVFLLSIHVYLKRR